MGEFIDIATDDGTTRGYLATPGAGAGPGVVVIQEWWGLVPHIQNVCDRFASQGFTALAPDLYDGATADEPDEAGKMMMTMNLEAATRAMSDAVDWLTSSGRVRGSKVGCVGFCMGGGLALMLACARPDAVGPVAPFYGLIPWPEAEPDYSALTGPVRGNYAAGDKSFPPDAVRALESKLEGLGVEVDLKVFPNCDHAFFNDDRPEVYNADAAIEAWERTLDLFRENLG